MAKPRKPKVSQSVDRLLARLSQEGAHAVAGLIDPALVDIRVMRNGITLGAGTAPLLAADALVTSGCAVWERQPAGPARLVATDAGRARAARLAAGDAGFLAQHRPLEAETIEVGGERTTVTVDRGESPLAWLHRRKDRNGQPLIDAAAYAAGERLRTDLTLAQVMPRVTANWSAESGSGRRSASDPALITDTMVAARQRVDRAMEAVGGEFAGLLIDVCGFLKGVEDIERERGWPARSGKVVLGIALGRLAEHYGLKAEARGRATSLGIRVWSAPSDPSPLHAAR